MIKSYSHQDVEKWGEHSGDRNRVHFDRDVANRNGLDDVIVQGMLVLLDAKISLAPFINTDCSLKFYIKKTVYIDEEIKHHIKQQDSKKTLIVSGIKDNADIRVTGTVLTGKRPENNGSHDGVYVSPAFVKGYFDVLKKYYSYIEDAWVKMDTLLFFIAFNQQKDDYFYRQSQKIARNGNNEGITTFHVAQDLYVSEKLLHYENIDIGTMRFSVYEEDVYINHDSAYSTFNIDVFEGREIIFQSSIACLTKMMDYG
ncbi:hypothetical protein [Pantoea sp.]|uniref:hypothetical protein n=1 Tax=Pantoea sp. TaxID=69393 RepID=UPI00289F573E|nr:hypothetical protein [Pantoea sp.]